MQLKYFLTENLLAEPSNDYLKFSYGSENYDNAKFVIPLPGKSSLVTETKIDALSVLCISESIVRETTLKSGTINQLLFHTSFPLADVFETPLYSFDNERHKLKVNLCEGHCCVKPRKRSSLKRPIQMCFNLQFTKSLPLGGVVEIRANGVKIVGEESGSGPYFISQSGA